MAGSTVKEAARSLSKTFNNSFRYSPFHQCGDRSRDMFPELRGLLTAMDESSPSKQFQKAATPKLLRYMAFATSVDVINDPVDHATDLIVGAFFFAMRSCEYAWSSRKGRTKKITLGGIKFLDASRKELSHDDPDLASLAQYVWICFNWWIDCLPYLYT